MSGFDVLARRVDVTGCVPVSVVATKHLVDVFQRPALRLGQRGCGKQRAGQIDAGQDSEAAAVTEGRYERTVDVRARSTGRQPDEATHGRRDTAHWLRKQLGVENARHARPAERIDRHEDSDANERQATSHRLQLDAVVIVRYQRIVIRPCRRRRRVRQRHVTGTG